ncbi:hypothetical protein DFH07DRAFT_965997 [Mycena maculata]|uniref:Uncharacterized protein n=1 Tax=Mycena maculata TaxID=230809 RepID=A0AAD7IAG7_9AGAR|nr:hypothetical protein DFH07DRAFT_965997 [Mycena maculata]
MDITHTTVIFERMPAPGRRTLMLQGLGLKWTPGAPLASPAPEDGSIKKGEKASKIVILTNANQLTPV